MSVYPEGHVLLDMYEQLELSREAEENRWAKFREAQNTMEANVDELARHVANNANFADMAALVALQADLQQKAAILRGCVRGVTTAGSAITKAQRETRQNVNVMIKTAIASYIANQPPQHKLLPPDELPRIDLFNHALPDKDHNSNNNPTANVQNSSF